MSRVCWARSGGDIFRIDNGFGFGRRGVCGAFFGENREQRVVNNK